MRLTKAFLMLPLLLLIALAAGAPDEAMGRVSKVVDGDTFDVTLESHSRISEDLIRIRLADPAGFSLGASNMALLLMIPVQEIKDNNVNI